MFKQTLALGAIVTLAAGCAGGSGTSTLPATPHVATSTNATLSILVGGSSTKSVGRKAKYVSASTRGASIAVTPNGATAPLAAVLVDLSSTSTACAANADGSRTCSIAISAPIGSDSIALALYDAAPVSGAVAGSLLSSTTFTTTIASGINAIKVVPNGVVASIALALSNPTPAVGAATTSTLTATARDADGNVIIGSEAYAAPITVSSNDASGAVTLSATTLASPSDAITVAYSGVEISKVTFAASASGVAASAISGAALTPQSSRPSIAGDTFTTVSNSTTTVVPGPSASPYTYTNSSQNQVTITTGETFDGKTGLIKQHRVTSNGNPTPSTIDFYFQRAAVGSRLGVYQVGYIQDTSTSAGPSGSSITGQSRLLDQLPETAGDAWTASSQYTGRFFNTPTVVGYSSYEIAQSILADGTLAYTASYPYYKETFTERNNPDGTATFVDAYANGVTPVVTYTFGKPTGTTIPITRTYTANTPVNGSSPDPAPSPTAFAAKNWYPNGVAGAYDTITEINNGIVPLPADCLLKTVTGTASALVQTETLLDVTGELLVSTTSFYSVPGIGVVCQINDTKTASYYSYDSGGTDSFSGDPTRSTTTHNVTSLQQTALLSLTRHPLSFDAAGSFLAPAVNAHAPRLRTR